MRIAYADPPYLGEARRRYATLHPEAAIYDTLDGHIRLLRRLVEEFPDGWALSCHVPSLHRILPLCPEDCRVGAWVKTFASFKPNVNPAYAWEPLIFRGGRKASWPTVTDWVACRIAMQRGLAGAKPEEFCMWIFRLLGMRDDDDLVDLFPGSGAVGRAWEKFRRQMQFWPIST